MRVINDTFKVLFVIILFYLPIWLYYKLGILLINPIEHIDIKYIFEIMLYLSIIIPSLVSTFFIFTYIIKKVKKHI